MTMNIYDYDDETRKRAMREDAYQNGFRTGFRKGFDESYEFCKSMTIIKICLELNLPKDTILQALTKNVNLSKGQAEDYLKEFFQPPTLE